MNTTDPDDIFARAQAEHLNRLEAIVQRSLDADIDVGNALAEICDGRLYRDTHQTFEAYLRERWGMSGALGHDLIRAAETAEVAARAVDIPAPALEAQASALAPLRCGGSEALANVWEKARHDFGGEDVTALELRFTVHKREQPAEPRHEPLPNPWAPDELDAGPPLLQPRWRLTQSSAMIADVVNQLETRAADLSGHARQQLRDDVVVIIGELKTLTSLLDEPVDWDAEYGRLLDGEIPPFGDHAGGEEDE